MNTLCVNVIEICRFILGLMQKERQIDTIIDKICARFKLATTERQWRDLSFCLSLLQFSGKSESNDIQMIFFFIIND